MTNKAVSYIVHVSVSILCIAFILMLDQELRFFHFTLLLIPMMFLTVAFPKKRVVVSASLVVTLYRLVRQYAVYGPVSLSDNYYSILLSNGVILAVYVVFALYHLKAQESIVLYKKQSLVDSLTGLYNRRFYSSLPKSKGALTGSSIIIFDIDRFKSVNDAYGHDAGDELLCRIATLTKWNIRPTDELIRLGGEEFIVFMPDTCLLTAYEVAENIRSEIARYLFKTANKTFNVTVSTGVTRIKNNESLTESTIRADDALYYSKRNGRNKTTVFANKPIGDCHREN